MNLSITQRLYHAFQISLFYIFILVGWALLEKIVSKLLNIQNLMFSIAFYFLFFAFLHTTGRRVFKKASPVHRQLFLAGAFVFLAASTAGLLILLNIDSHR
jgi:hypothetical protein